MLRDPKFWLTDPVFYEEFESQLRSGFRAWNGEVQGPGVSGSEGDNSPFRRARPKLTSYSDSPYPKTPLHTFLDTHGYFRADVSE